MAAVAPCPQIVQIESEIRPLFNWQFMVGVEMPFDGVVSVSKLSENSICGRIAEVEAAAVSDDVRFPTTIYTPPLIPLEAEDTQPAVVSTVSAVAA